MDQTHPQLMRLIACPNMLAPSNDRIDVLRPSGETITALMRSIGWTPEGLSARVFLDGELVRDAVWESVRPRAGQSLVIVAVPMGGGGQGKDAARIVAMVGVIAASILSAGAGGVIAEAVGWGTAALWGGAAAASTSIIGSLALGGLIPPPLPRRPLLEGRSRKAVAW